MSNIDKQALRINAQLASSGKWIKESGDGWEAICSSDDQANSGFIIAHFEGPDAKENREFIQAANPATVLALLDEMEAKDKRIAELEAREVKLPNPHAHLIWIQAGHAPDDYWDDVAVSHSEKDKCCDGSDRYPVYTLWEIKEALSAIGINIAAAGKGE